MLFAGMHHWDKGIYGDTRSNKQNNPCHKPTLSILIQREIVFQRVQWHNSIVCIHTKVHHTSQWSCPSHCQSLLIQIALDPSASLFYSLQAASQTSQRFWCSISPSKLPSLHFQLPFTQLAKSSIARQISSCCWDWIFCFIVRCITRLDISK